MNTQEPSKSQKIRSEKVYGCDFQWIAQFPMSIRSKYMNQKHRALRRGIDWEFTLVDWWDVWAKSGKWRQRGLGAERYAMARYGDVGPYSASNVYICTNRQNTIDANFNYANGLMRKLKKRSLMVEVPTPRKPRAPQFLIVNK